MTETVIRVENLGKRYVLGQSQDSSRYKTLRESVTDLVTSPFRRSAAPAPTDDFWALKDVSFDIRQGEVAGIIGRNGAGKSTLLKILSRITEPTTGRIAIKGRVASLLEVGTGFHPELTGRENIFLNGAILGMQRAEIKAKFDEIVAFAEVERFLDTPVKRYSSGMYVRLAFAVAAHLEPEILIVDEVLAVGDSEFQKKCLGKMEDVSKKEGRTVLFVSHNMAAVTDLTTRCILLDKGEVEFQGITQKAVSRYLQTDKRRTQLGYSAKPVGNKPQIVRMDLLTSEPNYIQSNGEPLAIVLDIFTPYAVTAACLTLTIVDENHQSVVQLWTFGGNLPILREAGVTTIRCDIPKLRLFIGSYSLTAYLAEGAGGEHFGALDALCPFEVVMRSERAEYPWVEKDCQYLEEFSWRLESVQPLASPSVVS